MNSTEFYSAGYAAPEEALMTSRPAVLSCGAPLPQHCCTAAASKADVQAAAQMLWTCSACDFCFEPMHNLPRRLHSLALKESSSRTRQRHAGGHA